MNFDLNNLFGNYSANNSNNGKNKRKRNRSLKIEELESRDMLSVSPFGNDFDDLTPESNIYDSHI